jgi:hypothetical protein
VSDRRKGKRLDIKYNKGTLWEDSEKTQCCAASIMFVFDIYM